jgi:hypothetical protein
MTLPTTAGTLEQVHDEKNIRRRVYDALNVLEAIGMISKVKKAIQWLGWPEVNPASAAKLNSSLLFVCLQYSASRIKEMWVQA